MDRSKWSNKNEIHWNKREIFRVHTLFPSHLHLSRFVVCCFFVSSFLKYFTIIKKRWHLPSHWLSGKSWRWGLWPEFSWHGDRCFLLVSLVLAFWSQRKSWRTTENRKSYAKKDPDERQTIDINHKLTNGNGKPESGYTLNRFHVFVPEQKVTSYRLIYLNYLHSLWWQFAPWCQEADCPA